MPEGGGPGANDSFDPGDLDDLLARVVMPVVNSIIKPGELERVDLGWGRRLPEGDDEDSDRGYWRPHTGLRWTMAATTCTYESLPAAVRSSGRSGNRNLASRMTRSTALHSASPTRWRTSSSIASPAGANCVSEDTQFLNEGCRLPDAIAGTSSSAIQIALRPRLTINAHHCE
jgi:hypothetical protein